MKNPSEPRERRSQRDYSLPFKLAVVGEVGRGEVSYKQVQRRYGIQGFCCGPRQKYHSLFCQPLGGPVLAWPKE